MENRYDGKLREGNQAIIDLIPGNYVLRIILALEIKKAISGKEKPRILEIGCGEGDLSKYILDHNDNVTLDVLDISPKMMEITRKNLYRYSTHRNINFICKDALTFLRECNHTYSAITSAWTVHNFKWKDKIKLFKAIYQKLNKNGKLFLMDKIYPPVKQGFMQNTNMLDIQCNRYALYLDNTIASEIISHEQTDFLA